MPTPNKDNRFSSRWAYLMLSCSALFWSGNFVIGRAVSTSIDPISLAYLRWSLALLVFFPFTIRLMLRQWSMIRQHFAILVFLGVVGVGGFNTFAYLGLQHTTATNALLINSFIPILIIVISRLFLALPVSRMALLGIVISSAGVLMLISRGNLDNLLQLQFNRGDIWMLGAALTWAVYSISLRWRPRQLSASAFLLFTMLVGVLALSPFYWLDGFGAREFEFNETNLLVIIYVALFASLGAFLCWNQGVKTVGAGVAGQFIHLMPVFGTLMAIVFLSEQLHGYHLLGALAIACGIYLTLRNQNR